MILYYFFLKNNDDIINLLNDSNNLEAYNELDDYYVTGFIKQLASNSPDYVLKKLALAFQNRHLFSVVELANEPKEEFLSELKEKGIDFKISIANACSKWYTSNQEVTKADCFL